MVDILIVTFLITSSHYVLPNQAQNQEVLRTQDRTAAKLHILFVLLYLIPFLVKNNLKFFQHLNYNLLISSLILQKF